MNNVFVRAKNLNNSVGSGFVNLYFTDCTLFSLPSRWIPVGGASGVYNIAFVDGSSNKNIAPSTVAITQSAFLITNVPGNAHYCLIAVVQTPAHPIGIPTSFQSNAAFSNWVTRNPGVAQRNISHQPSRVTTMISRYTFGNINSGPESFRVRVVGKGFKTGTPVTYQCTDQACPVNQTVTLPAPDTNGNQITGFDLSVPGNFSGTFTVTATTTDPNFPVGATLVTQYFQYPDMSSAFECAVARDVVASDSSVPSMIKLGECTVVVVS